MVLQYVASLLVLTALPAWFIGARWRAKEPDRLLWVLKALYTGAFLAYLLQIGRWDLVSVHLRYAIPVAFFAALLRSYRRVAGKPWIAAVRPRFSYTAAVLLTALFCGSFAWTLSARYYEGNAVSMKFPLQQGEFYVSHGGDAGIMNHHHAADAQRYALDIHELNAAGARANGLMPSELSSYVVFGTPVVSPCMGRVHAAVDRFADQRPGQRDREHVAGNHVVVACKSVLVLLAHLRSGSISVEEGATIAAGAVLGEVGNSGNTSEPHLHFHAVRDGSGDVLSGLGVPVTFGGTFPVRNAVL
jgi:hypothetical protein